MGANLKAESKLDMGPVILHPCCLTWTHWCNSQRFVKECITTKFKNYRKRSASEEVQIKKRTKPLMKNYLPVKSDNIIEVEAVVRRMKDNGSIMSKEEVNNP